MLRLFDVVEDARVMREAYRGYLVGRSGALDTARRSLEKREATRMSFAEVAPPPENALDTLPVGSSLDRRRSYPADWLLRRALSRVHAASSLGGEAEWRRAQMTSTREDDLELVVAAEHRWAAQLLAVARRAPEAPGPSRGHTRAALATRARASRLGASALLAVEIVHTIALLNLLRVTRDVLRFVPAARDAIEARLVEVTIDAVSHVSYRRLGLDAHALQNARRLVPALALLAAQRSPEASALGAAPYPSTVSIQHRLETALPDELRARAFFV